MVGKIPNSRCCRLILTLHLALGVDNDSGVVLEVDKGSLLSPPGLALANHNGRGHCECMGEASGHRETTDALTSHPTLLAQVGLSLLHAGHDHVSRAGSRQPVQAGTPSNDGNAVKVLCTGVVGAVHHRGHWETQGHAELVSGGSSLLCRHRGAERALVARRPGDGWCGIGRTYDFGTFPNNESWPTPLS